MVHKEALISTPNLAVHISKADFPDKVSSWLVLLIRCTYVKPLKCSTMTWADQMRVLADFHENCGTNPVWADFSWYTETVSSGLLSVSFLIDSYLFHFVIHWLLISVPNIHGAQRGTSSLKSRNIDGRTLSFVSLNMDLG